MDTKRDFSEYDVYVVGAGAIGRVVAAMLDLKGAKPTLIAREDSLEETRIFAGYTFIARGGDYVPVSPNTMAYSEIPKDINSKPSIIFYATKASYLAQAIKYVEPLFHKDTQHVFLQGGIPWWFGHALTSSFNLSSITDPDRQIIQSVRQLENVHAGMIKFGAELDGNVAKLKGLSDFTFGSVTKTQDGIRFGQHLKELFTFDTPLVKPSVTYAHLPQTIWTKASGSFAMSAFAMITGRTLGELYNCIGTRNNMIGAAQKMVETGNHIGIFEDTPTDWDKYFRGIAENKPDHMMSITKDPSEIAQIIESPMMIRSSLGLDMTLMDEIYKRIPSKYKEQSSTKRTVSTVVSAPHELNSLAPNP